MSDQQFLLRLPTNLHKRLFALAQENDRSMAAEIRAAVEKHLANGSELDELKRRVEKLEKKLS